MITPLAIAARTPKLADNARTIRKRAHTASYALPASHRVDCATPLDKDGINVRGTVGGDLGWRDGARHKSNVLTRHGQDRTLLVCVADRGELLLSHE